MKSKKIPFAITLAVYCFLFYNQTAGINFFIFSIILVGISIWKYPKLKMQFSWQLAASSTITTALMIVINNSNLAIISHFVSVALLIGVMYSFATSLYISLFHGFISSFFPFLRNINDFFNDLSKPKVKSNNSSISIKNIKLFVVPIIATVFFYVLYSIANPEFGNLIQIPKFSIPLGLISFAFCGLILLSGVFQPYGNEKLTEWDYSKLNILQRIRLRINKKFDFLALKTETKIGVIMLIMLNCLIMFFNTFDISFIFSNHVLPNGMNYSQYVHQGINTLIISIIIAISIILYFFRSNINFYKNNKWLIRLTYLWIIQNTILALTIVHKNQLYIVENGLTYKRIGVYIYLILTIFGLAITYFKVKKLKSIWYILRKNTLFAYLLLVISCFVDWDSFIAKFNTTKAKNIDIIYLSNLSNNALPSLKTLLDNPKIDLSGKIQDLTQKSYNDYRIGTEKTKAEFIKQQIEGFKRQQTNKNWQSFNYSDSQILKSISK